MRKRTCFVCLDQTPPAAAGSSEDVVNLKKSIDTFSKLLGLSSSGAGDVSQSLYLCLRCSTTLRRIQFEFEELLCLENRMVKSRDEMQKRIQDITQNEFLVVDQVTMDYRRFILKGIESTLSQQNYVPEICSPSQNVPSTSHEKSFANRSNTTGSNGPEKCSSPQPLTPSELHQSALKSNLRVSLTQLSLPGDGSSRFILLDEHKAKRNHMRDSSTWTKTDLSLEEIASNSKGTSTEDLTSSTSQEHANYNSPAPAKRRTNIEFIIRLDKNGRKMFGCKHCDKSYYLLWHLELHSNVHTGATPYPCSICDQSFATRTTRGQHMAFGHRYPCDTCQIHFNSNAELVSHSRSVHHIDPFKCHICNGDFSSLKWLNTHKSRSHGPGLVYKPKSKPGVVGRPRLNEADREYKPYHGSRLRIAKVKGKFKAKRPATPVGRPRLDSSTNSSSNYILPDPPKNHICGICRDGFANFEELEKHLDGHATNGPYSNSDYQFENAFFNEAESEEVEVMQMYTSPNPQPNPKMEENNRQSMLIVPDTHQEMQFGPDYIPNDQANDSDDATDFEAEPEDETLPIINSVKSLSNDLPPFLTPEAPFPQVEQLQHDGTKSQTPRKKESKRVKCTHCKVRMNRSSLKRHIDRVHLNVVEKCLVCDKMISPYVMKKHMQSHEKESANGGNENLEVQDEIKEPEQVEKEKEPKKVPNLIPIMLERIKESHGGGGASGKVTKTALLEYFKLNGKGSSQPKEPENPDTKKQQVTATATNPPTIENSSKESEGQNLVQNEVAPEEKLPEITGEVNVREGNLVNDTEILEKSGEGVESGVEEVQHEMSIEKEVVDASKVVSDDANIIVNPEQSSEKSEEIFVNSNTTQEITESSLGGQEAEKNEEECKKEGIESKGSGILARKLKKSTTLSGLRKLLMKNIAKQAKKANSKGLKPGKVALKPDAPIELQSTSIPLQMIESTGVPSISLHLPGVSKECQTNTEGMQEEVLQENAGIPEESNVDQDRVNESEGVSIGIEEVQDVLKEEPPQILIQRRRRSSRQIIPPARFLYDEIMVFSNLESKPIPIPLPLKHENPRIEIHSTSISEPDAELLVASKPGMEHLNKKKLHAMTHLQRRVKCKYCPKEIIIGNFRRHVKFTHRKEWSESERESPELLLQVGANETEALNLNEESSEQGAASNSISPEVEVEDDEEEIRDSGNPEEASNSNISSPDVPEKIGATPPSSQKTECVVCSKSILARNLERHMKDIHGEKRSKKKRKWSRRRLASDSSLDVAGSMDSQTPLIQNSVKRSKRLKKSSPKMISNLEDPVPCSSQSLKSQEEEEREMDAKIEMRANGFRVKNALKLKEDPSQSLKSQEEEEREMDAKIEMRANGFRVKSALKLKEDPLWKLKRKYTKRVKVAPIKRKRKEREKSPISRIIDEILLMGSNEEELEESEGALEPGEIPVPAPSPMEIEDKLPKKDQLMKYFKTKVGEPHEEKFDLKKNKKKAEKKVKVSPTFKVKPKKKSNKVKALKKAAKKLYKNYNKITATCEICDLTMNKNSLKRHILTVHEKIKMYRCKICDKCYAQKYYCDRHVLTHYVKMSRKKKKEVVAEDGVSENVEKVVES